ncbi:hypothetical protein AVEN_8876-1 [Araneus ventricosus]|uniref:RNase H type-1 domain-containing protein n=1 Tax=Araneus ventricosus TaxID=182803 RepID=A0A4Y2HET0_ARAVE|nr:hypothetical protein AVEN_8876-1 [Araneus ventricosus]
MSNRSVRCRAVTFMLEDILSYKCRFFGSNWRDVHSVLYNDSSFMWYENKSRQESKGGVVLKDAPELIAFGTFTSQVPDRPDLPDKYEPKELLAFGVRGTKTVYWFLCPNEEEVTSELLAIEAGLEAISNENNYGAVWILSDSRSSIQHLKDWNNVGDRTGISILKLLRHIGVDHEVHLQWIPSHMDIHGNEVADDLAKQGTAEPVCSTPSLTFDEIYSIRKNKDLKTWRVPPSHDWYKRSSPGGSIGLACDRADQTALSRFVSGQLRSCSFSHGNKVFPVCAKCAVASASPEHILSCLRLSRETFETDPLLALDFLRLPPPPAPPQIPPPPQMSAPTAPSNSNQEQTPASPYPTGQSAPQYNPDEEAPQCTCQCPCQLQQPQPRYTPNQQQTPQYRPQAASGKKTLYIFVNRSQRGLFLMTNRNNNKDFISYLADFVCMFFLPLAAWGLYWGICCWFGVYRGCMVVGSWHALARALRSSSSGSLWVGCQLDTWILVFALGSIRRGSRADI